MSPKRPEADLGTQAVEGIAAGKGYLDVADEFQEAGFFLVAAEDGLAAVLWEGRVRS
jgi:hypothetical protein